MTIYGRGFDRNINVTPTYAGVSGYRLPIIHSSSATDNTQPWPRVDRPDTHGMYLDKVDMKYEFTLQEVPKKEGKPKDKWLEKQLKRGYR